MGLAASVRDRYRHLFRAIGPVRVTDKHLVLPGLLQLSREDYLFQPLPLAFVVDVVFP